MNFLQGNIILQIIALYLRYIEDIPSPLDFWSKILMRQGLESEKCLHGTRNPEKPQPDILVTLWATSPPRGGDPKFSEKLKNSHGSGTPFQVSLL